MVIKLACGTGLFFLLMASFLSNTCGRIIEWKSEESYPFAPTNIPSNISTGISAKGGCCF